MKNFCVLKDTMKKVKSHPSEWRKIFAIHISMRDSYPEYIKDSYNSMKKDK